MAFVINHIERGLFVGHIFGVTSWSFTDGDGASGVTTFDSEDLAWALVEELCYESGGDLSCEMVEIVEVASGSWKDLREAGLDMTGLLPEAVPAHESFHAFL